MLFEENDDIVGNACGGGLRREKLVLLCSDTNGAVVGACVNKIFC